MTAAGSAVVRTADGRFVSMAPPIVCVCRVPVLGAWNECQLCFRKPAALLGVLGPAVLEEVP